MNSAPERLKDCKQRGEWAELCFMARATEEGLLVSSPYGASARYDVGIEYQGRHHRVQVKSCQYRRRGHSFVVHVHRANNQPYDAGDIDFLAAYLIQVNQWYILPAERLLAIPGPVRDLHITPGGTKQRWGDCLEAWHLLRGETNR